jgi:hypothetical protein
MVAKDCVILVISRNVLKYHWACVNIVPTVAGFEPLTWQKSDTEGSLSRLTSFGRNRCIVGNSQFVGERL